MKRFFCLFMAILLLFSLVLPSYAMENHVLTLENNMRVNKISLEQLEQEFGLKQGDLTAVTFLQVPQHGQLVSAGIPVEKGETLLRWELEELYYLPKDAEKDWFAIIPQCSREVCAVVNIVK